MTFQDGDHFTSENPLEEVWSYLERLGKPDYLARVKPDSWSTDGWSTVVEYASVRLRQSVEFRRAASGMGILTAPLPLYYSCLNLVRALIAMKKGEALSRSHGLTYGESDDLYSESAALQGGTFREYLDVTSTGQSGHENWRITLGESLSRIPEISRLFQSDRRGVSMAVPIHVRTRLSGGTWLEFRRPWVDPEGFSSTWQDTFPNLREACKVEENTSGPVLRLQRDFPDWRALGEYLRANLNVGNPPQTGSPPRTDRRGPAVSR